jgi:ribonuclease-3
MSEHPDVAALSAVLGVEIDPALLRQALTHRSFSYENGGVGHNERLEFLGDAILGQAVTVKLFADNPDLVEGELAKRRAALVSTVALAEVARGINLGSYLLLGNGEELTGGRNKDSILADATEAIFGATFVSCGDDAARDLVLRLIGPLMADPSRFGASMDPKTSLQELAAARGEVPSYSVEHSGPDHAREFTATVRVGALIEATGTGSSKKHAEIAAALAAWQLLSSN